jgi:tetratricopeptide (TPR) repeat protein
MRHFFIFMTAAVLLWAGSLAASPRSDFEAGLSAYRANDMTGAITAWERVVAQGEVSGPLYYNLGNAYYRANRIGLATLYYERAKKLMPRDRDVYSNLDLTHLATVDKIEQPVRLVIWNWIDSVRDYFTLYEIALIFQIIGVGAALSFLAWRFGPLFIRTISKSAMIVLLVVYLLSGSWYSWRMVMENRASAIVIAIKTDIYSAPDPASKQLFSLHEGTKVRCGEQLSGWTSIRLADGRKGWVLLGDVEKI